VVVCGCGGVVVVDRGGGGCGARCKSYRSLLRSEKGKLGKLPERTKVTVEKRGRGRPPKMTIQRYAENPPVELPKTDTLRLRELKELMIRSGGKNVAEKVIEIALNDDHPGQMAALKMCLDRTLPVSMFEKDKSQRNAITISITGLGVVEPTVIDAEDITDV
jgi:hypothetical protein